MKRLILSVIVVAFAVAVQAGDGQSGQDQAKPGCCASKMKTSLNSQAVQASDKEEGGCCASRVKTSLEAKGGCPFAAAACSMQAPAKQTAARQPMLLSPKALSLASR